VQFYWDSLATKQRCRLRTHAGSIWRVGTACSGTDSVVKVLEHLGRSSGWALANAFGCERGEAKQAWVQESFPDAPLIFPDICKLHAGRALSIVAREVCDIPAVDVFVAGFVCKSVSTENPNRGSYSQRIADAIGQGRPSRACWATGGVAKPELVICENVSGSLKRTRGQAV
jgi:site-specific DNA-cytosine methylase